MSQGRPVSPRDIELCEMPSIASQLPVKFENGTDWKEFVGCCAKCEQDIPSDFVRGAIIRQTSRCYTIEAVGVCVFCRAGTSFLLRLHDDSSITTVVDGVWKRMERPRPPLFSWMGSFLRSIFGTRQR